MTDSFEGIENFLANMHAADEVITAMEPMVQIMSKLRDRFVESGWSADAAELATLKWAEAFFIPAMTEQLQKEQGDA